MSGSWAFRSIRADPWLVCVCVSRCSAAKLTLGAFPPVGSAHSVSPWRSAPSMGSGTGGGSLDPVPANCGESGANHLVCRLGKCPLAHYPQITRPSLDSADTSVLQGRWRGLADSSWPSSFVSAAGWRFTHLEPLSEWKHFTTSGKDASRRSKAPRPVAPGSALHSPP